MNKQNSTDIIWYDKNVYKAIMALGEKYPNVIPVFGGALGAFNALEVGDIDRFEALMSNAVDNAKFYKWHESPAEVARRFCTICMVDPALIEAGFGMRFEEVFA
jgi:hypothetical protein